MTKARQEHIALHTRQQEDAEVDSNMPQAAEFVYESVNTNDQVQSESRNGRPAGSLVVPSRKRGAGSTAGEPDTKRGRFDANADSSGGPHPIQSAEARLEKTESLNDEGAPKVVISQATLHTVGSNAIEEPDEEEPTQEFTEEDLAKRTRDCVDSFWDFQW
ncbi:hypothetical protein CBS470a_005429 [Colletotrichum nupharicola]|nr:hypothetical protein CBS470a_005429 [Colletotrichum nupharicola]